MAGQLALGRGIDEIADSCAVTRETARSRLKQVFSKTGTHSQAQLVALLCSAPWIGSQEEAYERP
jgi:DNA-binding CsgD family transcriptional regulator